MRPGITRLEFTFTQSDTIILRCDLSLGILILDPLLLIYWPSLFLRTPLLSVCRSFQLSDL